MTFWTKTKHGRLAMQQSMKLLTFLGMLGALVMIFPHHAISSATSKLTQSPPLTLKQIEGLIQNRTPDGAIALEIERRSVAFRIDEEVIKRLKNLGGGSRTLRALMNQRNRIEESRGDGKLAEKVVVLVANFRSLDDQNDSVTEILIEKLREATADYSDIKIEPLGGTITALQGRDVARSMGKEHGARIVLWGWISKTREKVLINAHLEVIQETRNLPFIDGKQTYITGLSELNDFSLQTRLSSDMASVTLAAIALARFEVQDYAGAISGFTDALNHQEGPNQIVDATDIYLWRGSAYVLEGIVHGANTYGKAVNDFNEVIKLGKDKASGYFSRAMVYMLQEKSDDASADFNTVLGLESDPLVQIEVLGMLGVLHDVKGESKQSIDYIHKALQLTETLPDIVQLKTIRGQLNFFLGDYKTALVDFDSALALKLDTPALINIHLAKGTIYLEQNLFDAALNEFNIVLNFDPKNIGKEAVFSCAKEITILQSMITEELSISAPGLLLCIRSADMLTAEMEITVRLLKIIIRLWS
jgi:tetratricopeptide (TPR) repeat protein